METAPNFDKPKEECGIFGIFGHEEAANMAYLGLYGLQHRGQEACGIVCSDRKSVRKFIGLGRVTDFFTEDKIKKLTGDIAIGHVRYSTTGKSSLINAQPIVSGTYRGTIGVAHNGNITNTKVLRDRLEREGSIFQSTNDSEVLTHLIARSKNESLTEAVKESVVQLEGAFSFLIMKKDKIIALRDPNGFRPLSLGYLDGAYVVASETCAFDIIDAEHIRDIEPGEMIVIDKNGISQYWPFETRKNKEKASCVFELIYFAKPSSVVFNNCVYTFRRKLGMELAKEDNVEADVVMPVPDSGRMAAMGYSLQSGIPFEEGLIRSHYIGRTFIEPESKIRHFGVKIKFSPVRSIIENKRVVVIDDSLVRGTTSKKIVQMLRKAGAKEVHFRLSSPPIKHPCFFGIDFPRKTELIANSLSMDELKAYLGVESIKYISYKGMLSSTGLKEDDYCTACFSGKYKVDFDKNFYKEQLETEPDLFSVPG
jgi:amidophosphoribosyltransferase